MPWNWRIATAARAGPASGSITRQNVVKKPAPSIRAASSRSRGIDRKYWRIRKIARRRDGQDEDDADVLADAPRQAERVEQDVDRHEAELVRDHQRRQHEEEQDLAAGEAEPGEGVAGDAAEDEVGDRHRERDDRAVDEQDRAAAGSSLVERVLPAGRA